MYPLSQAKEIPNYNQRHFFNHLIRKYLYGKYVLVDACSFEYLLKYVSVDTCSYENFSHLSELLFWSCAVTNVFVKSTFEASFQKLQRQPLVRAGS